MGRTITFSKYELPSNHVVCGCYICKAINQEKEMASSIGVDFGYTEGVNVHSNGEKIKRAKLSPEDRLLIKYGVTDRTGNVQDTQLVLNRLFETVKDSIVADLKEVDELAKAEK